MKVLCKIKEKINEINEFANLIVETSKVSKSDAFKIALGLMFISTPVIAQTTDPWSNFYTLTKDWITGNLGKFLALLIFIIGLIMAIFTHSAKPIVFALILAVIIGGAIGLVGLFFNTGSSAFSTPSGW